MQTIDQKAMEHKDMNREFESPVALQQEVIPPKDGNRLFVKKALQETTKALFPVSTVFRNLSGKLMDRTYPDVTNSPADKLQLSQPLEKGSRNLAYVDLLRYALLGLPFVQEGNSPLIVMGSMLSPNIIHMLSKIPPKGKLEIAVHAAQAAGRAIGKAHAKLGL